MTAIEIVLTPILETVIEDGKQTSSDAIRLCLNDGHVDYGIEWMPESGEPVDVANGELEICFASRTAPQTDLVLFGRRDGKWTDVMRVCPFVKGHSFRLDDPYVDRLADGMSALVGTSLTTG